MDGVIAALEEVEAVECKPYINSMKKGQAKERAAARRSKRLGLPHTSTSTGGSCSDRKVSFQFGIFNHPGPRDHPWISRDTLQVALPRGAKNRSQKIDKILTLCKALDNMLSGRVQCLVRRLSPILHEQYNTFSRLLKSTEGVEKFDLDDRDVAGGEYTDKWPYLRFGNLGTTVAMSPEQSEKMHLNIGDHTELSQS